MNKAWALSTPQSQKSPIDRAIKLSMVFAGAGAVVTLTIVVLLCGVLLCCKRKKMTMYNTPVEVFE